MTLVDVLTAIGVVLLIKFFVSEILRLWREIPNYSSEEEGDYWPPL